MAGRRNKTLRITTKALLGLFKADGSMATRVIANRLPDDAQCTNVFFYRLESGANCIDVIVHSESFDDVPCEKPLPMLDPPTFERVLVEMP